MARPGNANEAILEALGRVEEVDPMALIIMTAAGTAGLCGQTGPLTRILNAFTENEGAIIPIIDPAVAFALFPSGVTLLNFLLPPPSGSGTTEEQGKYAQRLGMGAMNVVEAGITYTLAKNPEVQKAIITTLQEMGKKAAEFKVVAV